MRQIQRVTLPGDAQTWLDERQREADELDRIARLNTTARWEEHRPAMNTNGVRESLETMAGPRRRCMFCGDSKATDIEHFRPKMRYPEHMFHWDNFLLVCWPCNRRKGTKFPCDPAGAPLLIDPTREDPWDHLFFVAATGQVVPRPDAATGQESPRGVATTDPRTLPLNDESITEARRRGYRTLHRAVARFLQSATASALDSRDELLSAASDLDRPELVIWFLEREGQRDEPFASLLREHPAVVSLLVTAARPTI
jgi:uncharacterized protein (TIGR02646 family)